MTCSQVVDITTVDPIADPRGDPEVTSSSSSSYALTDLSSCRPDPKELQTGNALNYADALFAEMDFGGQSTSLCQSNGHITEHPDGVDSSNGVDGDHGDIYQYYYMLEDSHEDILKRLEEELMREEIEENEKAAATEKLMMEIEKGSKDFAHIRELERQKANHEKVSNEKRKEKEGIIELRRQLAIENRNLQLFCCFVCSKVFTEEENMRQHVSEKHLAFKKEYTLKCSKCYRRFQFGHHLRRHEETHKRITFTCSHCKMNSERKSPLKFI